MFCPDSRYSRYPLPRNSPNGGRMTSVSTPVAFETNVNVLLDLLVAGLDGHARQRDVVVAIGMAGHLVPLVGAALGKIGVLWAALKLRAEVKKGRLGTVARKHVEILRRIGGRGAVIEGKGHQEPTVRRVDVPRRDYEVLGFLGHAPVDGTSRHLARLNRGDAVAPPLGHIADGVEQAAVLGVLNRAGNLGLLHAHRLGQVGTARERRPRHPPKAARSRG